MGQSPSQLAPKATTDQLRIELARNFQQKCFSHIELMSFRNVFESLADKQDGMEYLKEDTIARFLEIPDVLGVTPIIFQMITYLGAFPFSQEAPAVLDFNSMVMVVVLMTEAYKKVLKKGSKDRLKLLFKSIAVFDRKDDAGASSKANTKPGGGSHRGFAVDEAVGDEDDEDDDDLAFAALESINALDALQLSSIRQASIPSDNLKKLIMLLLLIAPLGPQESLARHAERTSGDQLEGLRKTADCILAAFVDVEESPGVKFHHFSTVLPLSLPFLFNGFTPLFEHFLFSKSLDFNKRKDGRVSDPQPQPLLTQTGEVLDLNVLSQLSFFLPGQDLFRMLRLLYSGGNDGFSMGNFETKVLNWRAPTILLIAGNRIADEPTGGQERSFTDTLPPKRFPDSSKSTRVVFGVYLTQPWQQTRKECIGSSDTLLFQLEPVHEVFHASTVNTDYVAYTKPPSAHTGIFFGCPHPKAKQQAGLSQHVNLGAVSLYFDSSFEFGVFTHNYSSGGGAFHNSATRKYDWQDRFAIESLEVWGCGGDKEAEKQREMWKWEEREAEARRKINLGTGDVESDRALLEMAGIIGGNGSRSGGSMN